MTIRPTRMAFLWTDRPPYMVAGLRALTSSGCDVLFMHEDVDSGALRVVHPDGSSVVLGRDPDAMRSCLLDFGPDVLFTSSWHIRLYRQAAREARRDGVLTVLCMDNQWLRTPRQLVGIAIFRLFWRRCWRVAFVPGHRQARFARLLGYRTGEQWTRLYPSEMSHEPGPKERFFLLAARLVTAKGIDTLAEAYAIYRERHGAEHAWALIIAGQGVQKYKLQGPGIVHKGFLSAAELDFEFRRAACVVLPSLFEPWGVALQEGAQAACALIATDAVGAADHVLVDGWNGFLIPRHDAHALANAMCRVASAPKEGLARMQARSARLGEPYTADAWADALLMRTSGSGSPAARSPGRARWSLRARASNRASVTRGER